MAENADFSKEQHEYIVEQYKALRSESTLRMQQDRQVQRNGLLLIAAIYSLLLVDDVQFEYKKALFFLIPVAAAFTGLQQYRLKRHSDRIGRFCIEIEKEILPSSKIKNLGWEHFLHVQRARESVFSNGDNGSFYRVITGNRILGMNFIENAFWIALTLGSLVFGMFMVI